MPAHLLIVAALVLASPCRAQVDRVDSDLPRYEAVSGVSGRLTSIGSDTMNNLMTLWQQGFCEVYPNVRIEVEGAGSATAPPALIEGRANFGPMSRPMKGYEIDEFEAQYGYEPTVLRAGIDQLALYVHKDNPIAARGLTLQQVDAIFSKTRKGGLAEDLRTWGDVGLTGDWADKPISLYGRNSASGTYGYFKVHALRGGDFKDTVKEMPGSGSVVQSVSGDRYAMGYSGIGYRTADVVAVPIARSARSEPVPATIENAYNGRYPLVRFLLVYVNYEPNSRLEPLRAEFIRYICSAEGQRDVVKDGYIPLMFELARAELAKVGLELERTEARSETSRVGG